MAGLFCGEGADQGWLGMGQGAVIQLAGWEGGTVGLIWARRGDTPGVFTLKYILEWLYSKLGITDQKVT